MSNEKLTVKKQFFDGLIDSNPTLVQFLGMCPTLATTTSAKNALGMGVCVIFVLMLSNFLISLLRKLIPNQIRIAAYIVIISGVVTAAELLIKAYLPDLYASLGLFIPLIVVNCIILMRAESFASKNNVFRSILDGLFMGFGFTSALFVIGSVREILGSGSWFGMKLFGGAFEPLMIFVMPAGAFLTLGIVAAVFTYFRTKFKKHGQGGRIQ